MNVKERKILTLTCPTFFIFWHDSWWPKCHFCAVSMSPPQGRRRTQVSSFSPSSIKILFITLLFGVIHIITLLFYVFFLLLDDRVSCVIQTSLAL